MKKVIFILLASVLLAAVLVFVSVQFIFKGENKKGALQVTSAPESKVFLDNKYLGQTPLCKCEAADMLKEGEYTMRLAPLDKSLAEFQGKVSISEGILTVVDRKFGKDSLSSGSIISLSPLADKKKIELLTVSFPQGSTVFLDGNAIGDTPLLYNDLTESDHVIKIRKTGYKEKSIRIRASVGYKLTIAGYLSIDPDAFSGSESPQASASATPSATSITPSPAPAKNASVKAGEKVLILDTPTGFLRVHATSSLNSAEVTRVTPGDIYDLVDEQNGLVEIRLKDASMGWVSNQYVQKQ